VPPIAPDAVGAPRVPAASGAFALEVAGETLELLPDRAVVWRARRTLVVADIHFGKDDVFRRAGLAIPEGVAAEDLGRLSRLLAATDSTRLLVLGDFVHGTVEDGDGFPPRFAAWREAHRALAITVIAGNHDRHVRRSGDATRFDVDWQAGALHEGPFTFAHDLDAPRVATATADAAAPAGAVIAGHLHPVVRLAVPGGTAVRVPVFWRRPDALVLPAFGRMTGGQPVHPGAGDRLFAAGPERVRPLRLTAR
jgi:DNA ligase-associated metallophosphoesterase